MSKIQIPCLIQDSTGYCSPSSVVIERYGDDYAVFAGGCTYPYVMRVVSETTTMGWGSRSGHCKVLAGDTLWSVLVRDDVLSRVE